MGTVPIPAFGFPGIFYGWALLLNLVVQVIAAGFAIACAIALLRKPPRVVAASLARWSLYVATFAFGIPVCVGLLITWGFWSARPAMAREAVEAAGSVIAQAALWTSPTWVLGAAAAMASFIRLGSVPRNPLGRASVATSPDNVSHSPVVWYGASGNLVVGILLMPVVLVALSLICVLWSLR
jgi:hypothetical protein